jgi:hypothetical protein
MQGNDSSYQVFNTTKIDRMEIKSKMVKKKIKRKLYKTVHVKKILKTGVREHGQRLKKVL